jgi:hypothetical protein
MSSVVLANLQPEKNEKNIKKERSIARQIDMIDGWIGLGLGLGFKKGFEHIYG